MKKERAKDVLILLPGCYWVSLHWGADGRTGSGSAVTCCCCWVVERVVVDVVGLERQSDLSAARASLLPSLPGRRGGRRRGRRRSGGSERNQ